MFFSVTLFLIFDNVYYPGCWILKQYISVTDNISESKRCAGSNSTVWALTQQIPSTTWSAYEPDVIFWHPEGFAGGLDQCVLFVLTSIIYSSFNWGDTSLQIGIEFCCWRNLSSLWGFITELKTISAKDFLLNVILTLNPNGSSKWFLVLRNWGDFSL